MSGSTGGAEVRVDVTADIDDLRRNFAAGLVAIQDMERKVEAAQVRLQRSGETTARVTQQQAAANDNAADSSRRFGQVMGQAGFQIQDFAGQVAAGQSALVAFGQQGSQILGIFGPAGAIAGAALTIGVLVAQLTGVGQESKEAAEEAKKLGDEFGRTPAEQYAKAIEGANKALQSFIAITETATDRALRLRQAQTAGAFEDMSRRYPSVVEQAQKAERDLQRFLQNDAANLTEARRMLGNPAGLSRDQVDQLSQYVDRADDLADKAAKARQAADELRNSLAALSRRQNADGTFDLGGLAFGEDPPKTVTGREARGGGGAAVEPDLAESVRALRQAFGDLDGAQNTARANYERLWESMDPVSRITREYEERLVALREALSQNAISEQEYATAVGRAVAQREEGIERLSATAQQASNIGREMGTVFTSAFDGILTGSGKASDALQRFGQGIARLLERTFITRPLETAASSLFSAASSSLSSMFGSLFGSSVPAGGGNPNVSFGGPRAAGGPVDPSQWYLVGERGPEIFVPNTAGTIVANDAVSAAAPAMAAAGGGGAPVTINIDARGAEQGVEARIDAVLARRLPGVVNATKASLMADVNRGGRTAQTFGRRA